MNYTVLPNLIALTVLVVVFRAISRRNTSASLYLWLVGWVLVLLHFLAAFFDPGRGLGARVCGAISVDALMLAGIAFLVSVLTWESSRLRQSLTVLCAAAPAVMYATLVSLDVRNQTVFYVLIVIGAMAALAYCCRVYAQNNLPLAALLAVGVSAVGVTVWGIATGTPDIGVEVILAALYLAVALCYWRHYARTSAGVMTAVGGFVLWGAVFPAGLLVDRLAPSANIAGEVWNVPKYLVAVGMILTLLEDQIRTSDYFGYHDELTSVPNRRLLEDRLEQALAFARRSKTRVAVLQLDLDRFKEVNDTFGHPVGDRVLREVVTRLLASIRPGDTLARSGGDEFTVVSDVEDLKDAETLAASLEVALSVPVDIDAHKIQTGLSIGIALYPEDGVDPDQLHAAADRAMYAAKRAAHNSASLEVDRPVSA